MRRLDIVVLVAAGLAQGGCQRPDVTVMTWNLFLGAEVDQLVLAPDLPSLQVAVANTFHAVQATDFPARAEVLARNIAEQQPDVVGLQEVALFRTQTPADGTATPATAVASDYLRILLAALAARGVEYSPVAVSTNVDLEVTGAFEGGLMDVRLTDRDVILVRVDGGRPLGVSNPRARNFDTALVVPTILGPVRIPRGWTSVDLELDDRSFRVVNTHLEAADVEAIRLAEAAELLTGPAVTALPVILIGDFNERATAYQAFLAGLFVDEWRRARPDDAGFTCCQDPTLRDPISLAARIDLVLGRGLLRADEAVLVGATAGDRTASGLWPSDHAGLALHLALPPL